MFPNRFRYLGCVVGAATFVTLAVAVPGVAAPAENLEWRHYAADRAGTKYSAADQINAGNVGDLEVAWRWTTPDGRVETDALVGNLKGTPLMADGVVYAVSALNLVSAIDAATGKEMWTYDPKAYELHTPTPWRLHAARHRVLDRR